MSQSQEIGQYYQELKDINNGLDIEDLMYGKNGFYYSVYPKRWNCIFSQLQNDSAPTTEENKDKEPEFDGDPLYDETLWQEFKDWVKQVKGIKIKDFFDVDCEAKGLPLEITLTYEEVGIPENYEDLYKDNMEENEADLIGNYLADKYGYCHKGFSYQLNDNLKVVKVEDIDWDIYDNSDC